MCGSTIKSLTYPVGPLATVLSWPRKKAMMSMRIMHSSICVKSDSTRNNVVSRPVFQLSPPERETVVVGERPLEDTVLDTLDWRE